MHEEQAGGQPDQLRPHVLGPGRHRVQIDGTGDNRNFPLPKSKGFGERPVRGHRRLPNGQKARVPELADRPRVLLHRGQPGRRVGQLPEGQVLLAGQDFPGRASLDQRGRRRQQRPFLGHQLDDRAPVGQPGNGREVLRALPQVRVRVLLLHAQELLLDAPRKTIRFAGTLV